MWGYVNMTTPFQKARAFQEAQRQQHNRQIAIKLQQLKKQRIAMQGQARLVQAKQSEIAKIRAAKKVIAQRRMAKIRQAQAGFRRMQSKAKKTSKYFRL